MGTEANSVCHEEPEGGRHQIGGREHGTQDRAVESGCRKERLTFSGVLGAGEVALRSWGFGKVGLPSKNKTRDFLGGAVVKNPPANAGDTGSIPGPGRYHMPWSN